MMKIVNEKKRDSVKVPEPPSKIPWPPKRDRKTQGGCFPPGGSPNTASPKHVNHPHKTPTPNRRGR